MKIVEYINKTLTFIGLTEEEFDVEVKERENRIEIEISVPEEKSSRFIGARGRNLFGLQHLVRLVFREEFPDKNIVLDVNKYRGEKEDKLVTGAKRSAQQVLETGQEKVYHHLNSYERYLIHAAIAEDEGLNEITTYSANVEDQRWLTICLKEDAPKDR